MIPPDYFEIGVALDIITFLVTLIVASMSLRLYKLFRKPRYLQFSSGFFLMSASYLAYGLLNFLDYAQETHLLDVTQQTMNIVFYVRSVTLLIGLLLLIYLYYDIVEKPLQILMGALVLFIFILGGANDDIFFILSALLFFFIVLKLFMFYNRRPEKNTLFALLGFFFLFISKLLGSIIILYNPIYLIAYAFKLAGVATILYSLWVISR